MGIGARLAEADASASAPAIAVAHNTGQAVSQESDFTNDVFLPVVLGGTLGIGAVVLQNDDDDDDNGTPRQKKSAPRYRRRSAATVDTVAPAMAVVAHLVAAVVAA